MRRFTPCCWHFATFFALFRGKVPGQSGAATPNQVNQDDTIMLLFSFSLARSTTKKRYHLVSFPKSSRKLGFRRTDKKLMGISCRDDCQVLLTCSLNIFFRNIYYPYKHVIKDCNLNRLFITLDTYPIRYLCSYTILPYGAEICVIYNTFCIIQ